MRRSVRYTNKAAWKGLVVKQGNGRLMVVASAEGGPPVVHAILSQLIQNFPIPIVIYQVFESGAIDPLCNALNKTTQLTVRRVDRDMALLPGSAYVIPCGLRAAVRRQHGRQSLSIDTSAVEDKGTGPFVQFLVSACKVYGDRLMLSLVGGLGEFVESILPGLEAVSENGGDISFVREPGLAVSTKADESAGHFTHIDFLSADELVARLYTWCGLTNKVRNPI